jgi:hypothetical protein
VDQTPAQRRPPDGKFSPARDVGQLGRRRRGEDRQASPGRPAFNGYHGYFADPDNFLWEIAYNPGLEFASNGDVTFGV